MIRNDGQSGEIAVNLVYPDSNDPDLEQPSEKLEYVEADGEATVMFDVVIPSGVYHEITVDPA